MALVRVGVVMYRGVEARAFASCLALDRACAGQLVFDFHVGADCVPARNKVLANASKAGEPYVLFIDGDMGFTAKDFEKLLRAMENDPGLGAISGHYLMWNGSSLPVCNWRNGKGWVSDKKRKSLAGRASGIQEVDGFGAGFLLIRTGVLGDLEFPWFLSVYEEEGYLGHDNHFCKKLKEAGYRPSVHFDVKLDHVGPTTWRPE
jgi:hypothetical protein